MSILAPISAGELVDKITILRVKAQRIGDPAKEANVRKELALLEATAREHLPDTADLARLTEELTTVNAALWDIEDGKRDLGFHNFDELETYVSSIGKALP